MCTWIMKIRGDTVLRLQGIHCCMSVEEVQEFAPEISRANGWEEILVTEDFEGQSVVSVPLPDDVICRLGEREPVGKLEHRGRTIHFMSQERISATREYIASKLRKATDFNEHRGFLENLPKEFLKASSRDRIVRLLDRLAEAVPK